MEALSGFHRLFSWQMASSMISTMSWMLRVGTAQGWVRLM
jgi:hypothetical protein